MAKAKKDSKKVPAKAGKSKTAKGGAPSKAASKGATAKKGGAARGGSPKSSSAKGSSVKNPPKPQKAPKVAAPQATLAKATGAKSTGKSGGKVPAAQAAPSKAAKAGKPEAPKAAPLPMNAKRKLGLRGAAPWAARHAAKHAAEARARAAEPAPPGSARATIRVPTGAEQIKAKIAELHQQTAKVRTLRKRLDKGFWDIGQVLLEISQGQLYLAKGYGSFEAFLEREIDLGKMTSLKLIKISGIFQRESALDYGMERCFLALSALEGEFVPKAAAPSAPGSKPPPLPLKPPTRLVG